MDDAVERAEGLERRVFGTSAGKRPSKDNLRRRVVGAAIARANLWLDADGLAPLPDGLTPHGPRILIALGKNPRYAA